jgi:TnsA endonuclease N terminal
LTGRLRPGVCLDYESWNERAFIVRAELDPRVTEIYEQCLQLTYRDESRIRRTIVDFCITVDGHREWHEVKDDQALENPEERQRLWWIAKAFADRGQHYSVTRRSVLRNNLSR